MKITCQSCQSKYTVSDEKVQGKTVKIKCRKCGATILVNSGGVTTSGAGLADADSLSSAGPEGGQTFQVNVGEGDQRTMTVAEIVAAYNSSVITPETYVWADGMGDWQPLGQVDAIVAALNNPVAAAAPSAPAAAAYAPPAAAYAPPVAAYAPPAAAAYAPPAAASYEAPPPVVEAPRAAARRDPARRAPDLFGPGGGGMGQQAVEEVASNAPHYNGSAGGAPMGRGAPAGVGARDENSMLFSLSALTAKAGSSPGSKTSATNHEDSGVIDLKALANSANNAGNQQHGGGADLMPEHAGLFPLGAPPMAAPVASAMAMPSMPPPAASKTPIFIGIGIAVATLAIVGAFFAMKGGGEKPAAPVDTVVVAPPPPPTVAEVAPPPTATAEVTAAPTSSAVAKGGPVKGGGKGGGAGPAKGGGGATTAAAGGGAPPPPPPPKKSACGCAPSDLMCAMKCSAK